METHTHTTNPMDTSYYQNQLSAMTEEYMKTKYQVETMYRDKEIMESTISSLKHVS